jgi:GNAT superfamily N-acetyltransferase
MAIANRGTADRAGGGERSRNERCDVRVRPAEQPGDLGWVVMAHGELYAAEFGWDSSFEALVARIVADYAGEHDRAREAAWIAEVDDVRAGCVFCVAGDEPGTAKLRILLVDPTARGHGLGSRLVRTCVDFARQAGYRRLVLWTNDVLVSARRIYQAAGFQLVDQQKHHSFGHDLVGQNWTLDLEREFDVVPVADRRTVGGR